MCSFIRLIKPLRKFAEMGWKVLTHLLYSPDLVPGDFHLFGPLKESLRGGIKFGNDVVQQHVHEIANSTDKDFYAAGFTRLVECWEHCISLHRHYDEK